MAYLHSDVLDNGLNVLTNATSKVLHVCSAEPTSRAQAISLSLGSKNGPTVSAPAARTPSGRKVAIAAISDGAYTADGTVTHYALIDGSRLLAANALGSSRETKVGDAFTLAEIEIGIPGV